LQEEQSRHGEVEEAGFVQTLTAKEELTTFSDAEVKAAAEGMEDGYEWDVSSALEAAAAVDALTQRQPRRINITYKVHEQSPLTAKSVNQLMNSLTEKTNVHLRCLDSFYNAERDGRFADRERLSVCLSHQK
jgi:hypothetical protein